MSERIRSITAGLRGFFGNRRCAPRHPIRLPFSLTLIETKHAGEKQTTATPALTIEGQTYDLSATGIGLIVPAIRIGDHYLTGEARHLRVNLTLDDHRVEMNALPVRYEKLEAGGYLIGAHITEINPTDRSLYLAYIKKHA